MLIGGDRKLYNAMYYAYHREELSKKKAAQRFEKLAAEGIEPRIKLTDEERKQRIRERQHRYYQANRDKCCQREKEYRKANRERINASRRYRYHHDEEFRERLKASAYKWREDHMNQVLEINRIAGKRYREKQKLKKENNA